MKAFQLVGDKTISFSSCQICDAQCCDGRRGSVFTQIVLDDFKELKEHFPILFIKGNMGYIKPVILLSNGKEHCRFIENNLCQIYEKRPSICKVYPFSPHISNEIYIDKGCPAVDQQGALMTIKGAVTQKFNHPILQNYQEKFVETHNHFFDYNKEANLEVRHTIDEYEFYSFKEDFGDNFLKIHLDSLQHLYHFQLSSYDSDETKSS